MFAAILEEEMTEQRFPVPSAPTRTAATSEHRRERSENPQSAMPERLLKMDALVSIESGS
jgi:hypothetical protein